MSLWNWIQGFEESPGHYQRDVWATGWMKLRVSLERLNDQYVGRVVRLGDLHGGIVTLPHLELQTQGFDNPMEAAQKVEDWLLSRCPNLSEDFCLTEGKTAWERILVDSDLV